jgi:phosphate transport system substrate-binding protein
MNANNQEHTMILGSPILRAGLLTLTLCAFADVALADTQTPEDAAKSLNAQADRATVIYERGRRPHYTQTFDLSELPHYVPGEQLTGWIRIHGSNYLSDGALGEFWQKAFAKFQPGIRISYYLPTAAVAFAALYYDQADLAIGHKPGFYDLLAYQRVKSANPVEITAVGGSYDVGGWENSTVILVNEDNPLSGLTMQQLDGIFGSARDGGWSGTNFRPDWARGPEKNIRTWGQLGLTDEWADQPVNVYGFNLRYNTATDFADKVLKASDKWNENIRAFAHIVQPDGSRYLQADQITDALGRDKYGIAFNRYRGERANVKRVALAATADGPFVEHTIENLQNRSYPIINEQYFYFSDVPGSKTNRLVKEFLRYILSQEGQAEVQRDGKYLPLTAAVVRQQLQKLEQLDKQAQP